MTPVHALVPAAGRGRRFEGEIPKQFVEVGGRPLLAWTLSRLLSCGASSVTVALPQEFLAEAARLSMDSRVRWVRGGESRQESVERCLAACEAGAEDLVLVHDGARPLVAPEDVESVVSAAATTGAAILGRPVADTLKRLHRGSAGLETVDRAEFFRAETPQVFRREILERGLGLSRSEGRLGTDEASLVERLPGVRIVAVSAVRPNPKVTEPGDLLWLAGLLPRSGEEGGDAGGGRRAESESQRRADSGPSEGTTMDLRIGQGYDVHRLVEGRRLVLGGEVIPHPRGLGGFSDADVLLHALGDALLGAAGEGDLGSHFPPGEPAWRDASSTDLLRRIHDLIRSKGLRVVSCDLTLVAEEPQLRPYRERIRGRVAELLEISLDRVGLKATTNERLGAVGRKEGMAALAVVLLTRAAQG